MFPLKYEFISNKASLTYK